MKFGGAPTVKYFRGAYNMRTLIFFSILFSGSWAMASDDAAALYDLTYAVKGDVTSGKAGACALTITPKGKQTLKTTTPFKAMVKGSEGVTPAKEKYTAKDFVDEKAPAKTIETAFTPSKAGEGTVNANLTFFLCTDEICKRYKADAACGFKAK
jgi:hypothetical protein